MGTLLNCVSQEGWKTRGRHGERSLRGGCLLNFTNSVSCGVGASPARHHQGPIPPWPPPVPDTWGRGSCALLSFSSVQGGGPGTYKICSWCPGWGLEEATV